MMIATATTFGIAWMFMLSELDRRPIKMYKVFDSVNQDQPAPVSCQIKGTVPDWLTGSLYRNGSAMYDVGQDEYKHWFDGLAMIQKYSFENGQVSYQSQFIKSVDYKRNMAANRIVLSAFGTSASPDPCKTLFDRYFSYYFKEGEVPENTNVNLAQIGDEMYAMTETKVINRVDPKTLDTLEQVDLSKYVAINMATAHPLEDHDGTIYNIGSSFKGKPMYTFVKYPKPEKDMAKPIERAEIVATIPARWPMYPCYYHSFGMTENYLILVEQPMCLNVMKLLCSKVLHQSFADTLDAYPNEKCIFHVVEKSTGKEIPLKFMADSFFVFHHVNAYEEDNQIVMDAACYEDVEIIKSLSLDKLRRKPGDPGFQEILAPTFRRYVMPLEIKKDSSPDYNLCTLDYVHAKATVQQDGTIQCEPDQFPKETGIELPRINYDFNGRKYRYSYGMVIQNTQPSKLVKVDAISKESTVWTDSKGPEDLDMIPGEPVFVKRPGGEAEDDGVVLSPVISGNPERHSFLIVLDGKTFKEIGRAEKPLGMKLPYSFHGIYSDTM